VGLAARGGGKLRFVAPNRRFVCAVLCVSAAVASSAANPPKADPPRHIHLDEAYYAGDVVKIHTGPRERGEHSLLIGPWNFGPRVSTRPKDKRPNLYIVVPGTLHQVASYPDYDHTEILSATPDDPSDFDVYWALVLDPSVDDNFTAEKQLLVATQATFTPGEDFTFDQIPCAGFLRDYLKIRTPEDLKKYRRPDGSLPRVAIVTAGFALRLSIEKPEEKPEQKTEQSSTAPPSNP